LERSKKKKSNPTQKKKNKTKIPGRGRNAKTQATQTAQVELTKKNREIGGVNPNRFCLTQTENMQTTTGKKEEKKRGRGAKWVPNNLKKERHSQNK